METGGGKQGLKAGGRWDLGPGKPLRRISFDPGCATASLPALVVEGAIVEQPTGPRLGWEPM